jgi:hypothetical protein
MLSVRTTRDWANPKNGVIPLTLSRHPSTFLENHAVCVIGFDDSTQLFKFRNSWGPSWGDNGHGYLPFSYMRYYMSEAWAFVPAWLEPPRPHPGFNAVDIHQSNSPSGHPLVQTSTYDPAGHRTAWCFAILRDGRVEVEDLFVRGPNAADSTIKLGEGLISLRNQSGLPIRIWISHCDADEAINYNPHIFDIIDGLEFTRRPSRERWASAFAE